MRDIPPGSLFGLPLSNRGFIYLFNADLFLYDIFFGVLSLLLAAHARRGRRIAAQFGIGMGVYFVIRAGLQLYYFGTSLIDMQENVEGIEALYQMVFEDPLKEKDAKLADEIHEKIEAVEKLVKVKSLKALNQPALHKGGEELAVLLQNAATKLDLKKPEVGEK